MLVNIVNERFRVSFKVLRSRSFFKGNRLWVWRTHTMGFSPCFLGGSEGMLLRKMFENRMLENAFPGILGYETLKLKGRIKLQLYCENHVTQRNTATFQ